MFRDLCDYTNDPIEALFVRLAEDSSPDKIDLGIGVFRDDSGKVPVMRAVRRAEQQLFARDLPKSYMSPLGNQDYCRDVETTRARRRSSGFARTADHVSTDARRRQCSACGR